MAHGDGALHGGGGHGFADDGEMHVDAGEHFGLGVSPLGAELDGAADHGVAAALEDQHHVISRAATGAGQQQL